MTKRYTAIVEIIEVEETPATLVHRETKPGTKETRELAKFVVRDEDLAALKEKLGKHVELV